MFWRKATLGLLGIGIVTGIIFWGAFNWSMELTNTETFCVSCHEMKDNVYKEYTETVHYSNRTGVRAVCSDCHVPKLWIYKVQRKIYASNELLHHFLGTVDTRKKFMAKRLELAKNVWRTMKSTNSRECRNCHDKESMDYDKQASRSSDAHDKGFDEGKTCIDCHRGIAHRLPPNADKAYKELISNMGGKAKQGLLKYLDGVTSPAHAAPAKQGVANGS